MKLHKLSPLAVLVLSGCVYSVHPLSDDSNSVLDKRLLGRWEPVEKEQPGDGQREVHTVQKKTGTRATLQWSYVIYLATGEVKGRGESIMFATRDRFDLLSIRAKAKTGESDFHLFRYEVPQEGLVRLIPLDDSFVAGAVERGELRGSVKYSEAEAESAEPDTRSRDGPTARTINSVTLDDTPKRIIEFINLHGARCFEPKAIVMRRISPPPDGGDESAAVSPVLWILATVLAVGCLLFVLRVRRRSVSSIARTAHDELFRERGSH